MKKIELKTSCKRLLADVFTPVGIYLRLRDRFRDTILLESTDNHAAENSYSFICINAIAGMEITSTKSIEFKLPGQKPEREEIKDVTKVPELLWDFMKRFDNRKGRFGAAQWHRPNIVARLRVIRAEQQETTVGRYINRRFV